MDREGFRNRLKQYKEAKGFDPQLKYWDWKQKYNSAPQPNNMPSQPQPDQPTVASQPLDDRAHRWDNGYVQTNRQSLDSPHEDTRYYDYRKPRFEFRKGDVHYSNPNLLKFMGRFGKVLRGGSLLGETIQNLFPSEEAELIEDLRVKMDKQNKWLTGQEDIPKYDEGTGSVGMPSTTSADGRTKYVYYDPTMDLEYQNINLPEVTITGNKNAGKRLPMQVPEGSYERFKMLGEIGKTVGSFLPVVGEMIDTYDLATDIKNKDWTNTAIRASSYLVPNAIEKGLKYGKNLWKNIKPRFDGNGTVELVSTYLTPNQVNILRKTDFDKIKDLPNDVITDYQFNQIFGTSKGDYINHLLQDIERKRPGLPQRAKDMFIKQNWESNLGYQGKIAQSVENLKFGYTNTNLVNESINTIKSYFNSDRYKTRLLQRGIDVSEINWLINKLNYNVDDLNYFLTDQPILLKNKSGTLQKINNALGVYHSDVHGISTLPESSFFTKIHELSHASDRAAEIPYNSDLRMTPIKQKQFEYYSDPTEQRARAIVTDIAAQKMGLSAEEYISLPYEQLEKGTQELLDNFDKSELKKYLRNFAGLSIPIAVTSSTIIENKENNKYAEGGEVQPNPLEVLERSRPKVAGIPINDPPIESVFSPWDIALGTSYRLMPFVNKVLPNYGPSLGTLVLGDAATSNKQQPLITKKLDPDVSEFYKDIVIPMNPNDEVYKQYFMKQFGNPNIEVHPASNLPDNFAADYNPNTNKIRIREDYAMSPNYQQIEAHEYGHLLDKYLPYDETTQQALNNSLKVSKTPISKDSDTYRERQSTKREAEFKAFQNLKKAGKMKVKTSRAKTKRYQEYLANASDEEILELLGADTAYKQDYLAGNIDIDTLRQQMMYAPTIAAGLIVPEHLLKDDKEEKQWT